jgi:hypothetical protein
VLYSPLKREADKITVYIAARDCATSAVSSTFLFRQRSFLLQSEALYRRDRIQNVNGARINDVRIRCCSDQMDNRVAARLATEGLGSTEKLKLRVFLAQRGVANPV